MSDIPGPFNRYAKARLRVSRVRINSGGYDSDGAYWGVGAPLYHAQTDSFDSVRYMRASDREAAKRTLVALYPNVTFHR